MPTLTSLRLFVVAAFAVCMQMHSSYVVTDPKGLVFRGQSKGYYASSVFYLVL